MRVVSGLRLFGLLLMVAFAAAPIRLEAQAIRPEDPGLAVGTEDGKWDVTPGWVGFGGAIPRPVLDITQPLPHDATRALGLRISSRKPVVVWFLGVRTDGNLEVFPSRLVPGDGAVHSLLWSIDARVGRGSEFTGFKLVVGQYEPLRTEDYFSVRVHEIGVPGINVLSDDDYLAASSYAPLTIQYAAPQADLTSQELVVSMPSPIAARQRGGSIVVRDGDETVAEIPVDEIETTGRRLFQKTIPLPVRGVAGEQRTVRALLRRLDASVLDLGQVTYRPAAPAELRQVFEVPNQSIVSYALFDAGPDLGVITVVRDLFARDEPEGAPTMTHEVQVHQVSLRTGRAETQPAWRVPAFAVWAEAGFRTISAIEAGDATAIFVTGTDGQGLEHLGLASTSRRSPVRPAMNNPIFAPAPEFTGWTDGWPSMIRGAAFAPYGRTFFMVALAQAAEEQPRVLAALSPALRDFADAGVLDLDLPWSHKGLGHLDLSWRGDYYYLLTDDPTALWTSRDPLRAWQRHEVALPVEWHAFRLREIDGKPFLFGLFEHEGKTLLRWTPVHFEGEPLPLPIVTPPAPFALQTTE
jgi:hypothetical protein